MSEKMLNTRIVHKHDTEENWGKAVNFTPRLGEFIVYDADENYPIPRLKIGDGETLVSDLPFASGSAILLDTIDEICGGAIQ